MNQIDLEETHHKTPSYKVECNLCDETFDQIWKLEKHMETHSDEKAFTCNICGKKIAFQWCFKKHAVCQYCKDNNSIFIFEETRVSMFRHETAPTYRNL